MTTPWLPRVIVVGAFIVSIVTPQEVRETLPAALQDEASVEFVCPMDPDVRSLQPGKCWRCGMALVAGIPDDDEYRVTVGMRPRPQPGRKVRLALSAIDPKTGKRVTDFQVVHEKLYHLFIVGQDLQFFVHDHP